MNNKILAVGVVVAILLGAFALFGGSKIPLGGVSLSEQIFDAGILTRLVKYPVANTLTAATNNLTVNDLNKGDFWKADTTSNAVVVNFPTIPSDFVGRHVVFAISAGTNALNMNAMNSDVTAVTTMTAISTFTTPNAVGDWVDCLFTTTAKATCVLYVSN